METAHRRLGDILLLLGAIDQAGLDAGLREQQRWGEPLGRVLIGLRLAREEDVVFALAAQLNLRAVTDLDRRAIAPDVLALLSGDFCQVHALIPFRRKDKELSVALADPRDEAVVRKVEAMTSLRVVPFLIGPRQLARALHEHYGVGSTSAGGSGPGDPLGNA
jgi:type IV pilus assembly protein PilB